MNDLWIINVDDINNDNGQAIRMKNLIINLSKYYGISLITSTKLSDKSILKKTKRYWHCKNIRLYSENIKNPKSVIFSSLNILRCINRLIDNEALIYTDFYPIVFIIKKFKRTNPVIIECHGSNVEDLVAKKIFRRDSIFYKTLFWIEKMCWSLADGIVVNNEQTKKMIVESRVNSQKIFISSNGVNIKIFRQNIEGEDIRKKIGIENEFLMIYIGSFRSWHGIDNLLYVLKKLNEKHQDIKLLLVGDGSDRKKMEKKAESLGIKDKTIFNGFISHNEIPKYIAAADICPYFPPESGKDHTRSFSGTPIKFFEYLAMGKPIITTNQPEFQFIKEKKCGILTNNNIDEFIKEIEYLYKNKKIREKIGKKGTEFAYNERSWEKISEDIHQFLLNLY